MDQLRPGDVVVVAKYDRLARSLKDLLEIVVISDASSDATDSIVKAYADRGVRLARQAERRGKTAGLNAVVPHVSGDIVVFSDANAMYAADAIRMLVRNFSDPSVGCVTGEARYVESHQTAADEGERAYWNYEIQIKRLETAVGDVIAEGDSVTYDLKPTRDDPTAVGTSEYADAIIERLR